MELWVILCNVLHILVKYSFKTTDLKSFIFSLQSPMMTFFLIEK